jgi:hypothetical protein
MGRPQDGDNVRIIGCALNPFHVPGAERLANRHPLLV